MRNSGNINCIQYIKDLWYECHNNFIDSIRHLYQQDKYILTVHIHIDKKTYFRNNTCINFEFMCNT